MHISNSLEPPPPPPQKKKKKKKIAKTAQIAGKSLFSLLCNCLRMPPQ